ncbi:MAG: leucyl aminopeptidase [Halothiobacillaceae bacterium]|nr:leucyl aminopeptidase [Halothiobacillaceae bacterium]
MLEYSAKSGSPEKQRTACLVLGIFETRKLSPAAELVDQASEGLIGSILRRGDMDGKAGDTLLLHHVPNIQAERVLLVGLGKEREFDLKAYQKAMVATVQALNERGSTECVSFLSELPVKGCEFPDNLTQAVLSIENARYRFDQLKSKRDEPRRPLRRLTFVIPHRRDLLDAEATLRQAAALVTGINLTRDLANLPGNLCTPSYLADQARKLTETYPQLSTEVLDESRMEKLGMGALLAVARGSAQPPKLIVMEHMGGEAGQAPVVLVGKGVTFDTGGISLKPGEKMDEMKYDMSGAATVLGLLSICAELQLPINVVGIVPTVENMPDGQAIKPGDIVTSLSGQTIEILNTDAEGRLILCDALTYAARYKPDVLIDIATLTGACVIALGRVPSGLWSNHRGLANELTRAGEASGDRVWEMPLWEDYQELLKSNFADMANIGGREGGAISAACFLSRFTSEHRWAHLDIAGTAWVSGEKKGATGRPVPLLARFLMDRATRRNA